MSGRGLHRHERGAEDGLVVPYGVVRGHDGVYVSVCIPGEYPHLHLLVEGLLYRLLRCARTSHVAVSVAPPSRLLHDCFPDIVRNILGEGSVRIVLEILEEGRLEILAQMLDYRFFCISLHPGVDGGVDGESVLVQTEWSAVGLERLVDPAVQGIVLPQVQIREIVLLEVVVVPLRLGRAHVFAQHVPEIGSLAGVVVLLSVVQHYRQGHQGVGIGLGDVAVFAHLADDVVAPRDGLVVVEHRVVAGGLVDRAHQCRALLQVEVYGLLIKEGIGRRLDAVGVAAEEYGVHIHGHDLVLGVVALQLYGGDPFLELADYQSEHCLTGEFAGGLFPGEKSLGQLLCDGAASSSRAGVPQQYRLDGHPGQAAEVYAAVLVETCVLSGHGCLHQIGGQVVKAHVGTVLDMIRAYQFAVLGYEFGGQIGLRVLQFLEGRNLCKDAYACDEKHQNTYGNEYYTPDCGYESAFGLFFHFCKINIAKLEKIWFLSYFILYFATSFNRYIWRIWLSWSLPPRRRR